MPLVASGMSWAQDVRIENIELVNMATFYRVIVHCSGDVRFAEKFTESPPQVHLYLRDTGVKLDSSNQTYRNPFVTAIITAQWKKIPPIAKITISLRENVIYQVKKRSSGLIFVDLKRAAKDKVRERVSPPASNGLNLGNASPLSVPVTTFDKAPSGALPKPLMSLEPISLDVKNAEIASVLRLLSKQTGLNIVTSQDVKGRMTLSLQNVTTKGALDMIAKASGYDYSITGDIILVKPREKFDLQELQTKVYRLKYVNAYNLSLTLAQVLSPQAKIRVFHDGFQAVVKSKEGQTAKQKGRSSILLITDLRENFAQVEAMIAELDAPTPQIMIEAKLIEISPQDEEKLGIDWSKTINTQIFREVLLPSGTSFRSSVEKPLDGGGFNFGTLSLGEYGAVINFLDSHTNTKLISNPRILATDNQEAIISVGTNVPIPQINRGVGGQGDVVTFEYRDVNISLRVTPHMAEDETISLHVNAIIEEITGEVLSGESRAPVTSKREVETVVNLKNNETMVIGGLIKESTIDRIDKVWLLGDIPLIGNFFRHKNKSQRQTDLLIFITPRLTE